MTTVSPETIEALAEAYHERYRAAGAVSAEGGLAWVELPDRLKDANRASARMVPRYLALLGYEARAAGSRTAPRQVAFSEAEVERLARIEHRRWVQHQLERGYVRGPQRDDAADPPVHPDLVSWTELDEPTREKDRRRIRDIPALLAEVGYELVPVSRDGQRAEATGDLR